MRRFLASALLASLLATGCGGSSGDTPQSFGLRLIGQQTVSNAQMVDGTLVGGLSGLDYDIASGTWILISDDRSEKNPARFYTARLQYDAAAFSGVQWLGSTALRRADGRAFPSRAAAQPGDEVPDPEAIRFDPRDPGSLWWTSEGDRSLGLDPFVARADRAGVLQERLPLPAAFRVSATQATGTRNNLAFEGLSFTADGASLWVGMEAPLYQDGPVPTPGTGAMTRLLRYDRNGRVAGQVAYPLDPIPATPAAGKNADNGLSELLALDDRRLLVLERAGVQGADDTYRNFIRLYEADLQDATDVNGTASLAAGGFVAARKRLVLDLNTLGLAKLDNVEGMAWGPLLANGNRSLVMVSDNNFNGTQITQLLAFEVVPR